MMKKKAIWQDFKIEIIKSKNRFFSILLIVALGVAFFAGIRATQPDMQISADRYYDNSNLMDIRVLSTLGLTDEDVEAIRLVEGVQEVEPSYSMEALSDTEDSKLIVKLISQSDTVNQITILDGRLPNHSSECLVDEQFFIGTNYKLGDTISIRSGTETDLLENLNRSEFTIVGVGTSAYYLSFDRGSSSIGNGKIDSFIIIPKEVFRMEAYSEVYITVKGAKDLISYTDSYEVKVEDVLNNIKAIAANRSDIRYEQVLQEPFNKIKEGKAELAENERKAKNELSDAAVKIAEAKVALADGELQIKDAEIELSKGKEELEENKKKLLALETELKEGQAELNNANTELETGEKLLKEKQDEYQVGVGNLASGYEQWNESMNQWNSNHDDLLEKEQDLKDAFTNLLDEKAKLEPVQEEYAEQWQTILVTEQSLKDKQTELELGKTELLSGKAELDTAKTNLDLNQLKLDEALTLITQENEKLVLGKDTLKLKSVEMEQGLTSIDSGWKELNQAETTMEDSEALLKEKREELEKGKITLVENETEYQDAVILANDKISDGKKQIEEAEEKIKNIAFPEWYVLDRNSIQTYVEYGQDSLRIGNIGKVFPAIFFLVAALVSLTTMTRMVEEQRTQIGTLKALGYSKSTIAGKYILYGLIASLIGSLLGVLIGEQVLPKVIITAYTILYHNLPKVITPINLYYGVISTLLAVLCTTLATIFACYKELMAAPATLMRPASPKLGKRVLLERITWLWKHLNFTQKSTVRNLFRYKKRFFMTVFGIGGCMALLLVGFGLKDSISAMSDIQYVELWYHDAVLTLEDESKDQEKNEVMDYLQTDKHINNALFMKETTVDVGFGNVVKSINLIIPKNQEELRDMIVLRDRKTKTLTELQDDAVIVTEKLASLLGVSIGDTLYLKDNDTKKIEVKVSGIVENYMMHYIFMSQGTYQKLYGEAPEYNKIYLKYMNIDSVNEDEFSEELLKQSSVESITLTSTLQSNIEDMLNSLNIVVYVLIISAGLLAFVVLYNLNNININERQRELATLKVLGFHDMEVATYVYRENIMLTVIGAAVGIILGIVLHRFVIVTTEIDAIMFGRNIKLVSYVYSILLTFGFSFFVNYIMFYKLQKIDMVESLKSVE